MHRALPPLAALACMLGLAACGAGNGRSTDPSSAGTGSETVAPQPPPTPLPASLKGYELYAWDDEGNLRFTLITGTNRPKTAAELTVQGATVEDGEWVILNRTGLTNLTQVLDRIPAGTPVVLAQHPDLPPLSGANRTSIEEALAEAGF